MKHAFLTLSLVLGLAAVPSFAAEKPAKEHSGKEHAKKHSAEKDHGGKDHGGKDHADKEHGKKNAGAADKDKCAEMMEHNKAPNGDVADASKKGCGMGMGKKKGLNKD